jgi:hypothetical protein
MVDDDLARALAGASGMTKCWLLLGAFEGLRCQEIAGLEREDVIEGEMKLRVVHGKGRKERMLPLHPEVLAALPALPMPLAGPLFRRPRKLDQYPPPALVVALNKYLRELDISSTAHTLRHWFGTAFYNQTQDLRLTQEMMGHEDPATTALYTQPDWQKTAPAVAALSVKGAGSTTRSSTNTAATAPAVAVLGVSAGSTPSSTNTPAQLRREAAVERQRLTLLSVPPVFATIAARDAEALRLHELEFSYRQIARQLGWAVPNTAFEAVRRARAKRTIGAASDTYSD